MPRHPEAETLPARIDSPPINPLALLQHAIDRDVQPAQLKELMDLANSWQDREASLVFGERFAAFQAECPPISKTRLVRNRDGSARYTFASLDDVDAVIRPILARHKLSISGTINVEGEVVRVTWSIQSGAHREIRVFSLPCVQVAGVVQGGNGVQDMGAWMQYLRRYTYTMALNVVVTDEDSDANSLSDLLTIDAKQRDELGRLIAQERMDDAKIAKLLKWVGAESLDAITQPQFQKIVTTYRQRKATPAA